MTTVLMSTPLLDRIQGILQAPRLFQAYVVALKMDDPSASHTQVMNSIQAFLTTLPAHTRLAMQRVFAEAEAADSLGKEEPRFGDIILFFFCIGTLIPGGSLGRKQTNSDRGVRNEIHLTF